MSSLAKWLIPDQAQKKKSKVNLRQLVASERDEVQRLIGSWQKDKRTKGQKTAL
jgi:hypothetical protein